ncbi:nuclear transport factor 2 family protein [Streptomyces lavendulocolor]
MTHPPSRRFARAFYEAFDTDNPDLLDEKPALDWTPQPPVPGNPGGPEGQKQTLRMLHSILEDLRYTVEDVVVSGDTAAVRARLSGRQTVRPGNSSVCPRPAGTSR